MIEEREQYVYFFRKESRKRSTKNERKLGKDDELIEEYREQ